MWEKLTLWFTLNVAGRMTFSKAVSDALHVQSVRNQLIRHEIAELRDMLNQHGIDADVVERWYDRECKLYDFIGK